MIESGKLEGPGLSAFSDQEFRHRALESLQHLNLVAAVSHNGDDLIVEPYPCKRSTFYRVPAASVTVISNALEAYLPDGESRQVFRILIDRHAVCTRVTEGIASDLILRDDSNSTSQTSLLTLQAQITFGASGEGTLRYGANSVKCLGKTKLQYPSDLTVEGVIGVDKFRTWHSTEFDVDMPFAVKIWGQRGIFVHEGPNSLVDNDGDESAGCIHLANPDAESFFNWVSGRTRITISYPW